MSIELSFQTPLKLKHVKRIKQLLNDVASIEGHTISNLSVVFTSDEYLIDMNRTYLKHDYYTDIITFDYSSVEGSRTIFGELYISVDRANENANQLNIPTYNEYMRLMIHGILHLCGYKDDTPESKALMTAKENQYLTLL